jgi:hypothetical protein
MLFANWVFEIAGTDGKLRISKLLVGKLAKGVEEFEEILSDRA